jgi:hypothetical protein
VHVKTAKQVPKSARTLHHNLLAESTQRGRISSWREPVPYCRYKDYGPTATWAASHSVYSTSRLLNKCSEYSSMKRQLSLVLCIWTDGGLPQCSLGSRGVASSFDGVGILQESCGQSDRYALRSSDLWRSIVNFKLKLHALDQEAKSHPYVVEKRHP